MLARRLPRFKQAYRFMRYMAQRESWPRKDIESFQLQRLNWLWSHATTEVPYYKRLVQEYDLPSRFESLEQFCSSVPSLSKDKVRFAPNEFRSRSRSQGSWHRTGGSTGTPMRVYWSRDAHREMLWCKYRQLAKFGVDIFDRTVFIWGHDQSFAPGLSGSLARWKRPLVDRFRNRLRLSAYRLDKAACHDYMRKIRRFQPKLIYAYSSALELLAREAGSPINSLAACIVSAEPAPPAAVRRIEDAFGVPTAAEYGSVECGIIATESPDGQLRIREDVCFVECRPCGHTYELLVTVLNNPAFPLIRYAIEDHTDGPIGKTDYGFSTLANVVGRSNDFLRTATGKLLHPNAVKHVIEGSQLGRFRCVQDRSGQLTIQVESRKAIESDTKRTWVRQLSEMLEGYPVGVTSVETLPLTRAGKHRWVVCEMCDGNSI